MPIRQELGHLYPPHWKELSRRVRFDRAEGILQVGSGPLRRTRPLRQVLAVQIVQDTEYVCSDGSWEVYQLNLILDDPGQLGELRGQVLHVLRGEGPGDRVGRVPDRVIERGKEPFGAVAVHELLDDVALVVGGGLAADLGVPGGVADVEGARLAGPEREPVVMPGV